MRPGLKRTILRRARALRSQPTAEDRMSERFTKDAPKGPPALEAARASAGPSYCFMYEDTTVPPGVALDAWRRMRR